MNTKNVLLGILIVFVFAVGFMVGRFSYVGNIDMRSPEAAPAAATINPDGDTSDVTATEGTTIQTSSLSEGQIKLLGALGIDAKSIDVTPEMIACAEASLGPVRIEEIIDGATPSFTEGLKLAKCYK